jgi:type III restriction enzyme
MVLVNLVRERLKAWKAEGYPGVTRTTLELLKWWQREGRKERLFYAQIQAVEAIIFITEARSDFWQGISVPRDLPNGQRDSKGDDGFIRYALKLATGGGKTTVMGMLAAWSILNKPVSHARLGAGTPDAVPDARGRVRACTQNGRAGVAG